MAQQQEKTSRKGRCFRLRHAWTAALLAILATGCATVGPNYVRPDTSAPQAWHAGMERGLTDRQSDAQSLARWWSTLGDATMTALIEEALENNLDIKQARASIREARAQRSISRASLFPTLDASGSATRSRSSGGDLAEGSRTLYSTLFDASWEIDLFGGVRRSVEAADADLQASTEELHGVLVSLTAEVALSYIELRTYQARLNSAETNLENQAQTYDLTVGRSQAGLVDELVVQQAKADLESTRAEIPTLRTGLEGSLNRLAVLLGKKPGTLGKELEAIGPIPAVLPTVAVGVPADTLRQRPDIRKAERELAAQTARVGVAEAELYPKLSLSGSFGINALSSGDLLSGSTRSLSFGPGVTLPIFHAGSIRQGIEVQSAKQEQALISYESAVLGALEEVENALTAYAAEQSRRDSLKRAVEAGKLSNSLATIKYEAGLIDFLTLLDTQRTLLNLEDQLASSDGTLTSNLVRLYKALGGGWPSSDQDSDKISRSKE